MSTLNFRKPANDDQRVILGSGVSRGRAIVLSPIFIMATDASQYDPRTTTRDRVYGYKDTAHCHDDNDASFNPALAQQQLKNLQACLLDLGASLILSKDKPDAIDGVFRADPGITFTNASIGKQGLEKLNIKTLPSHFYNRGRSKEVERYNKDVDFYVKALLQEHGRLSASLHSVNAGTLHGEGTGDNVFDPIRDIVFCGYKPKEEGKFDPQSGRSDPDFHKKIQYLTQKKVLPLEVKKPFFHLDTCLEPLPNGKILCCKEGLTDESYKKLTDEVDEDAIIPVSFYDAFNKYACNVIIIDEKNIVIPKISSELRSRIETTGVKTHQVDISQFILGAGGTHCLTNRVNTMSFADQKLLAAHL